MSFRSHPHKFVILSGASRSLIARGAVEGPALSFATTLIDLGAPSFSCTMRKGWDTATVRTVCDRKLFYPNTIIG
jgi:hypothetical protein